MYLLRSSNTNFGYNFTNSYQKSGKNLCNSVTNVIPLPISDLQLQFSEGIEPIYLLFLFNN